MLDVSYIGNRGSRLNHHFQTLGVDANMNDPSVLALGRRVLQSDINSDLAAQAPASSRRIRASTATSRRRCASTRSTSSIQWRGVPTGESQYHALEVVLERRFSRGLQAASATRTRS